MARKSKSICEECGGAGTITTPVDRGPPGCGYYREDRCEECDGTGERED